MAQSAPPPLKPPPAKDIMEKTDTKMTLKMKNALAVHESLQFLAHTMYTPSSHSTKAPKYARLLGLFADATQLSNVFLSGNTMPTVICVFSLCLLQIDMSQ